MGDTFSNYICFCGDSRPRHLCNARCLSTDLTFGAQCERKDGHDGPHVARRTNGDTIAWGAR